MSYTGIPKQSQILLKSATALDESSVVSTVDDITNIEVKYVLNGTIITCLSNAGHYIYLPNATDITTSPVSGSWYLLEQLKYDKLYPLNCYYIALGSILYPSPVSPAICKWEEVSNYDDKVLYPSSTQDIGSTVEQSITIKDHTLTVNEIPSHRHYVSSTSTYGTGSWSSKNYWAAGDTARGAGTGTFSNVGGGQGHNHTVAANAKLNGITIKIYKRSL